MPVPEELEKELMKELLEEFEKHLEAARNCPMTPGSLEKIMTRGAQRMARLTQETLARAASEEADFPPSGLSPLRGGETVQSEDEAADSDDGVGGDSL
jgi:hypothetical protein